MIKFFALIVAAWLSLASIADATFPVVASTSSGVDASATANHSVALPSDFASGDIVIIGFVNRSEDEPTFPAGWDFLADYGEGCASVIGGLIKYRRIDGTESSPITITTPTSVRAAYWAYRITGAHATTAPQAATQVISNCVASTAPDPGSLTASWGSDDNLFISATSYRDGGTGITVSAYSTNYADNQINAHGATPGTAVAVGVSSRNLAGATDNPGAFTITATAYWSANTVVVRPAPAAAGCKPSMALLGVGC